MAAVETAAASTSPARRGDPRRAIHRRHRSPDCASASPDVGEGVTSDAGKFQFAEGRKIDFLVGGTANRIAVGSATPGYTAAASSRSACTTSRSAPPNGDIYLSNLLRLLALLDANNDTSDGFQIDTAANTAIGAAVTGTEDAGLRSERRSVRRRRDGDRARHGAQSHARQRRRSAGALPAPVPPVALQQHRAHRR